LSQQHLRAALVARHGAWVPGREVVTAGEGLFLCTPQEGEVAEKKKTLSDGCLSRYPFTLE